MRLGDKLGKPSEADRCGDGMLQDNLEQEIRNFIPLMKERQKEIKRLRLKLDGFDWKDIRESEQYYPLRFFVDGLSAYVYVFDNAAVFYAWAAIEHALLIRLGANALRQAVAANHGRYPGEKQLVTIARKNGIISANKERVAHRLRKLRNDYMHYFNIMWDQHNHKIRLDKLMDSQWPKIVKEIKGSTPKHNRAAMSALLDFIKKETDSNYTMLKRQVPYIPGEPPGPEAIRFRGLRIKQFTDWVWEAKDVQGRLKRYEYGIERKDALDCLRWSGSLLTYLSFLPK
jgi:hypothetical protein